MTNIMSGAYWFDNVIGYVEREIIRSNYVLNSPTLKITDALLEEIYQNELAKPERDRLLENRFYKK